MLKRDITYEDFNGDTVTEVFYFNLTKSELIELQVSYDGGLEAVIQRIVKAEDLRALVSEFKKLILLSYGERTADGKRFVKNDDVREAFSQTAAYDKLFVELSTDDEAAVKFVEGIMPFDMVQEAKKAEAETVPIPANLPPPPNATNPE